MPPSTPPHRDALLRACEILGSPTKLAEALEVSQQRINNWLTRDKSINAAYCADIERVTNGHVSRKELRPLDWMRYWPELETV